VKEQRLKSRRCIIAAVLVTLKGLPANACVSETGGVVLEREGTVGCVCVGIVVHKRAKPGGRAEAARSVVKERIGTDSRVALTGLVMKKCNAPFAVLPVPVVLRKAPQPQ